jgi:hypothetical protein
LWRGWGNLDPLSEEGEINIEVIWEYANIFAQVELEAK